VVRAEVVRLEDYRNEWVIGTPDAVKESKRFSAQIQIHYTRVPDPLRKLEKKSILEKEIMQKHAHIPPIEEYYFVLEGWLIIEVDGDKKRVEDRQILPVPPNKCHYVADCSEEVTYLTIRAPFSSDETKLTCK
jgi:mannose-6-phosphate isomerase-like protein (cupin superfamily)